MWYYLNFLGVGKVLTPAVACKIEGTLTASEIEEARKVLKASPGSCFVRLCNFYKYLPGIHCDYLQVVKLACWLLEFIYACRNFR